MDCIVSPPPAPNFCVEALTSSAIAGGEGAFGEVITVILGHKGGAMIRWD